MQVLICDPLSENLALPTIIEFELERTGLYPAKLRLLHQGGNYRGLALYHTEEL